jgi:hypothetical protein
MTQALKLVESSTSPSPVECVLVRPGCRGDHIDEKVTEHLAEAIKRSHNRIRIEHIWHLLDTEEAQLVLAIRDKEIVGAVVTEFVEWVSGRRSLRVILCGGYGALDGMEQMMKKLEEIALLGICQSVIIEGRKGWARVMPEGYEFSGVILEKELF